MNFYDEIYYSLVGQLTQPLPWVPNAFAPGSDCDNSYTRLLEARDRILERLNSGEDPDLEILLSEMDTIQHILCREILGLRVSL